MALATNPEFNRTDTPSFGGLTLNGNLTMRSGNVLQAVQTPVYATPLALDPTLGDIIVINTTSGVGNATLNLATVPAAGQRITLIINNDSGSARTITFGTNFRMVTSTIVGTASKVMIVHLISDGTNAIETSRTVAIT